MERTAQRWLDALLAGRALGRGVVAVMALAVLLLPGLLRLSTDNSPRIFFIKGSPAVERYAELQSRFGSDKLARVVLSGPDLWTAPGLEALRRLEEGVEKMPGVGWVSGLYGHFAGRSRGLEWPPSDPEAFRRRALADPLSRDLGWVDRRGRTATLLVGLAVADNRERAALLSRLEERLATAVPPGLDLRLYVAGTPVLDRALDRSTREVERRFFPLLVALAVVLLIATFRRPAAVGMPLIFVALVELTTLGLMGWAGVELNLVLAVLPPLLFVISLATAVHLLVCFLDFRRMGASPEEAARATYRDKGWAVLWTGASTFVGFASLTLSKVGPVRTLGLWAALGIAVMVLFAFTVFAMLLPLASGRRSVAVGRASYPFQQRFRRRGRRWAEWAIRRRSWVLGVAAATAVVALAGLPRLRLETNALHYLPPAHPVRADIEALESEGIGMATVELMLTVDQGGRGAGGELESFESLQAFGRLAELSGRLRREPLVLGAVGAGDLLEDAVRGAPGGALFGAATVRRVAFDRLVGDEGREVALGRFLTPDGRAARLTLLVRTVGEEVLRPLMERTRTAAREVFPGARVETTGELPLVLESQRHLMRTLGWSLSLTVLCVAGILRLLLPSTRLTLLAMVPNLWPVVGVVGIMGWAGVPLDVATVMVASVVLGLAVDDTIHTLGHFRELAPRLGRLEAVAGTLERTAPAYLITGLILGAGFAVCALSDFAPTARFGMLSAAAIVLAVLGDLFLLPALLGSTPVEVVRRLGRGSEREVG